MRIIVAPAMRSKFKYYQQKGLAEFFNTIGQQPTKSPIVCLGSDSRHWGLKSFDKN